MDPLSITASVVSVTSACLKTAKTISDLREKYKHAQTTISALCAESTVICASLAQLQSLILRRPDVFRAQLGERPELAATFDIAVTGCVAVFSVLDDEVQKLVAHGLEAGNDVRWADKAKFLWKESFMKDLLQQIRGLQSGLTLLMQVMQLESISDLHQLMGTHGLMLERIASQTRSLRSKHTSAAAPVSILESALHDSESVVGTWGTEATGTSFTFDNLIVDSKVYRRILAKASTSLTANPSPSVQESPTHHKLFTSLLLPVVPSPIVSHPIAPTAVPSRLLGHVDDEFFVFETQSREVRHYDILSYVWGKIVMPYNCGILGVKWNVVLSPEKLGDIKKLMIAAEVQYLWVDAVCIDQSEEAEKEYEIARMFDYYKHAGTCHVMVDMVEVWNPQDIFNDLEFIEAILNNMGRNALASEVNLTEDLTNRLAAWADRTWTFSFKPSTARSAAIEMGVLNCYSTCMKHIQSLSKNRYFSRVWSFPEILFGRNLTMWGVNEDRISCIGELQIWIDLVSEARDKAYKLRAWIEYCKLENNDTINPILNAIEEYLLVLDSLQLEVLSISSARTDIITGGPGWWHENHKGISNVFAAISLRPRECMVRQDIFLSLAQVFSGLFTAEEIKRLRLHGRNDIETISFAFFKQLSIKTGSAWTRLAFSSRDRGQWDWIPVMASYSRPITTDIFAGVVNLGRLKPGGLAETTAVTGILGVPRLYAKIKLHEEGTPVARFYFKGCNCGKTVSTGVFSSRPIPTLDQCKNVTGNETGKILVQYATILGSILDPGGNVVQFRRRLLQKFRPDWVVSDANAKRLDWIDRCVSGTFWENPDPALLRTHNLSMHYDLENMIGCQSRLYNMESAKISCEVLVKCGCLITAPFAFIIGGITSIEGCSVGDASASRDRDNRVFVKDGQGLLQIHDVGKIFHLVAFGGDVDAHESFASICRNTEFEKPVAPWHQWPIGRALVREEFKHGKTDITKDYGYVETEGSGNLLISRNRPMDEYKIIGVCIDDFIANKKGYQSVTIR